MNGGPFQFTDPDDYSRVRDVFRSAGYTDQGIVEALDIQSLSHLGPKRHAPLLRRTSGGTPLETLIRLFILGATVQIAEARRALAPMSPEHWASLGLFEVEGDSCRATVQVRCFEDLLVAWDFSRATRGVLNPDYVMGISPSTLTLAGLTVRGPNRSVLDLGTGCGFQAFMATRHSSTVTAVDKNARAVAITEFNARLNDLLVESLEGDMFGPVTGRQFDLVVSNPPFIISPDNLFLFLHSGLRGDEICQQLAKEAPVYLTEGGYCQFLTHWAVVKDEDWRERLAGWFQGSGCDVWVLFRGIQPRDEYAATWIETETDEAEDFSTFFDNWMAYYERQGIEAVGSGLITMRRNGKGPNWFRISDAPETMAFPCGDDIERVFRAQDYLAGRDDASLLDSRFQLASDVRLIQQSEGSATGWQAESLAVRKDRGLQYVGAIDSYGAELIGLCDGNRPMRDLLSGLAAELRTDPASVTPTALAKVRRLLEQGFLLPPNG